MDVRLDAIPVLGLLLVSCRVGSCCCLINHVCDTSVLFQGYQGNQYKQATCTDGRHLVIVSMDVNQRAIQVYDLDSIEYTVGGDKHLSAIDKTKAYVGEGRRAYHAKSLNSYILFQARIH